MGILNKIFTSKAKLPAADLSVLGCDIHSHFIPGIDDGAKVMRESVEMIEELHQLGYKKVITTPHVMSDYYKNTPEIILGGLDQLRKSLQHANIPTKVDAAAEYYLDGDLERKVDNEKMLTFGKNYLLFEISYLNAPDNLDGFIFKLQTLGYQPILAHPERYPFWYNKFEKYEELKEKGVLLQLNINSLTGYYSIQTKKIAEQLIDKGLIDFLGSDCHHGGHIDLMKKVVHEKYLHKLIESGNLLNNTLVD